LRSERSEEVEEGALRPSRNLVTSKEKVMEGLLPEFARSAKVEPAETLRSQQGD
jgi:hypothetical protein